MNVGWYTIDVYVSGIAWKLPSQLVINKDPLASEVVTGELLQEHLSLDYLHSGLVEAISANLLVSLGVQSLTTQHLLDVGRVLVDRLSSMDTDSEYHLHTQVVWGHISSCLYGVM